MINTHARTRPPPHPRKKNNLESSLFSSDITLDLLGAMTLCCESQTGDSEGVLMTKHLLGVSGYERRSRFCFSAPCLLNCVAAGDTMCMSTLVNALRSPQKWIICWTNTGNVSIVFVSCSGPLQTSVKQKRDGRLSQSLYREGFAGRII